MELSANESSLEELMERYQAADRLAVAELFERLSPDLLRFFLAQLATRSEAEDLLQDTWLRIHRARHTYRAGAPLRPWIFAIARHVRTDGYRKRSQISRNETAVEPLPERASLQSSKVQDLPAFENLIATLPTSQREVLTLMKVNGLSLEQTALATSSTVGSVKQKASRAYAKLRSVLNEIGNA